MSDAQSLLVILTLIYLSDCLIWLPRDAVAVVLPLGGRPVVRRPSSWAGNDRGGLAFTTLLPARAVFVSDATGSSFRWREIDASVQRALANTRVLRVLASALFCLLFFITPLLTWRYGFAQIGLSLLAVFAVANTVIAVAFFRAHRRLDVHDRWHRWTHAIVMLVATPSAVRAVDQATRRELRGYDPLAIASRLAGNDHPIVRRMLRELAHPVSDATPSSRYAAARKAGLIHHEEPPQRSGEADLYCPRCLSQYVAGTTTCGDCGIALQAIPMAE